MSHTYETQEICCFLADVQIILVSLFEFFDYVKVAKNAGAFLSRCSELLGCVSGGIQKLEFQGYVMVKGLSEQIYIKICKHSCDYTRSSEHLERKAQAFSI